MVMFMILVIIKIAAMKDGAYKYLRVTFNIMKGKDSSYGININQNK